MISNVKCINYKVLDLIKSTILVCGVPPSKLLKILKIWISKSKNFEMDFR
jgi:hypothetical protein